MFKVDIFSVFCVIFIVEVRGQCDLPSPEFLLQKTGFYLFNHTVQSMTSDSETVCRIKCYLGDNCMSYNYHTTTGACDINDSDDIQHPKDLVEKEGFIYVGTTNDCASQPCSKYCSCKASVRVPGHKCICKPDRPCDSALGMEDKSIKNHQITASSSSLYCSTTACNSWQARLHNQKVPWIPLNGGEKWLQVDLEKKTKLTAIATQGFTLGNYHWYVRSYSIQYREYEAMHEYGKVLVGNTDTTNVVKNDLNPAIVARYVRIYPADWSGGIALRIEIYGCPAE